MNTQALSLSVTLKYDNACVLFCSEKLQPELL